MFLFSVLPPLWSIRVSKLYCFDVALCLNAEFDIFYSRDIKVKGKHESRYISGQTDIKPIQVALWQYWDINVFHFLENINFFPNQKQKGSRESKLMKILVSQCVSAKISKNILIFRYDWQGHRKQTREIKCASCLHKTKCYPQGRDRLRLKLASSPQVKELLGEIVINCPPRHLLFVKYCIF